MPKSPETPTIANPIPLLAALTPDQRTIIDHLATAFRQAGEELHLVGGVVRDLLLERPAPTDLDFATSALPEQTRAIILTTPASGTFDMGEQFGTIGAVFGSGKAVQTAVQTVEITTYRAEQYEPRNRKPAVRFSQTIEDDLSRRDITINAIALNVLTGELLDPFHGQADIAMGVLRAVGDPDERLREDPLRMLRIARFVAQLGFGVEPETEDAIARQAQSLKDISQERIYGELCKLLTGEFADHGLESLLQTGLLCEAMPELLPLEGAALGHPGVHREKDLWDHTKRVVVQAPARINVRWAALLHDAAKPLTRSVDPTGQVHFFGHERIGAELATTLLRRLHADKATERAVHRLVDMHLRAASYDKATWTDSAVRRLALEAGEIMEDLLDLAAADVTSAREEKQRAAAARVQGLSDHLQRLEEEVALSSLQSPIDGNRLMTMFDRPPGRWIADVKDHLRDLVIEGTLAPDDVDAAETLARAYLAEHPA